MASISSAVKIEYHADDLLKYEDFLSLEEDQDNAVDNSEPQRYAPFASNHRLLTRYF